MLPITYSTQTLTYYQTCFSVPPRGFSSAQTEKYALIPARRSACLFIYLSPFFPVYFIW